MVLPSRAVSGQDLMSIRGKPGQLVTYAKGGGRIPLGDHIPSRREVRQNSWTSVDVPPEVERRAKRQEQREASESLDAMRTSRPLKPPARRPEGR